MKVLCSECGAEISLTEEDEKRVDPLFVPYWKFYCSACKANYAVRKAAYAAAEAARPIIGSVQDLKDYVESVGECTIEDRGYIKDRDRDKRELAEALAMIDRLGATSPVGTSTDYLAQLGDA